MKKWFVCLCFFSLAACGAPASDINGVDAGENLPDATAATDAPLTAEEIVLARYADEARAFEASNNLPVGWADWMIARKDWYAPAYVRARTNRHIRIRVLYDLPVPYNPPWESEQEHFAALKKMAELIYVGWDFDFSLAANDPNAEFTALLGYQGPFSQHDDRTKTVRLIFETAFSHEFAHLLSIGHHYCDCCGQDLCADANPPGEGACLMSRNSYTWGPAEQFLLGLGPARNESEAEAVVVNIRKRYPENFP